MKYTYSCILWTLSVMLNNIQEGNHNEHDIMLLQREILWLTQHTTPV